MNIRNTIQSYGLAAKTFHWIIGLLILTLLCVGLYMVRLKPSPGMFKIFALHKSLGITVLALATLRIIWRFANINPVLLPNHQQWEKILAKLTHGLLYLAMFVMPLSGWIMSSAKGFSVSVFNLFTLPDIVKPDDALSHFALQVHNFSAYTLIVLIGLHVAGALKHHFIDRDRTLLRMLPCTKEEI
jgi:cytochrome b561